MTRRNDMLQLNCSASKSCEGASPNFADSRSSVDSLNMGIFQAEPVDGNNITLKHQLEFKDKLEVPTIYKTNVRAM